MKREIIIWENTENWINQVENLIITKDDDLPTIDELQELSPYEEIDSSSFKRFLNSCSNLYIRAYHACRSTDLNDYYENGIKIPDKNYYYELLDIYYQELNAKLLHSDYLKIKQYIKNAKIENKVFFNLSKEELLKRSSHYLIYGSECLLSAFASVFGEYAQYFLEDLIGIQTVFKVDVPIKYLNEFQKRSLYLGLLKNRAYYIDNGEIQTDFTITLNHSLSPNFIIDHFHPKEVKHSHRIGELFKFRFQDC